MWMRKTAHSHSLSFLFFSFLPKTHDGGCAIVRPGCRVFFFFQNTYKKAPPAQEISPARKEPYCFFTVILWSQPAGKRIIHTPKQDWNASVPKPPSWREVAFASANDGGSLSNGCIHRESEWNYFFRTLSTSFTYSSLKRGSHTKNRGLTIPVFPFTYDIFRLRQYSVPDTAVPAP